MARKEPDAPDYSLVSPVVGKREKMPQVTMTGCGVTVQGEVAGVMVSFERLIDVTAAPEDFDADLDFIFARVHRQRAIAQVRLLRGKLVELRQGIALQPEKRKTYLVARAADRARQVASQYTGWQVSGKRGDFQMSASERANLENHDAETAREVQKFDSAIVEAETLIPDYEKQIAVFMREITSHSLLLEEAEEAPLAEAAE
jgi:hypothetical protein